MVNWLGLLFVPVVVFIPGLYFLVRPSQVPPMSKTRLNEPLPITGTAGVAPTPIASPSETAMISSTESSATTLVNGGTALELPATDLAMDETKLSDCKDELENDSSSSEVVTEKMVPECYYRSTVTEGNCRDILSYTGATSLDDRSAIKMATKKQLVCADVLQYKCGARVAYARTGDDFNTVKIILSYGTVIETNEKKLYYMYRQSPPAHHLKCPASCHRTPPMDTCIQCLLKSGATPLDHGYRNSTLATEHQVTIATLIQSMCKGSLAYEVNAKKKKVKILVSFPDINPHEPHYMYTDAATAVGIAGVYPDFLEVTAAEEDSSSSEADEKKGDETSKQR